MQRCTWSTHHELETTYHDQEWGVPVYDDNKLFEMLTLEGAQSGLSWLTILKKREGYQEAFAHFDINTVAAFTGNDIERLVTNPNIVRHRQKIASTINNAQCIQAIQKEHASFSDYIWAYVDHTPLQPNYQTADQVPSQSPISANMSRALKKAGFSFVGPTTCYSFMQACGMTNDHTTECFRHAPLS